MRRFPIFVLLLLIVLPHELQAATSLADNLSGRILLQVESKGEAWYVNPANRERYSLGRPSDAFALMRKMGIGISNGDLVKIPVGSFDSSGADIDKDGLSDDMEASLGTDKTKKDSDGDGFDDKTELLGGYSPMGPGKISFDNSFASRQVGKIFLQVQGNGEAWYVDPVSKKRFFLGRPADAFSVMRSLGLGISNANLALITVNGGILDVAQSPSNSGEKVPLDLGIIEQALHKMVNEQRAANGLQPLKWNDELAAVAREHSQDQARENLSLTDFNKICNYAIIHHEGLKFGLMPVDRLNNRGINYFSRAGENIALIGVAEVNYLVNTLTFNEQEAAQCQADVIAWNEELESEIKLLSDEAQKKARLEQELKKRQEALAAAKSFKVSKISWHNNEQASQEAVDGWMNSPGHRANILNSDYGEAGIGVSYVNGYIIATQVFIKRATCGYAGGPCCERNACYLPSICGIDQICR
jgi:uncharacterized protein YkwD